MVALNIVTTIQEMTCPHIMNGIHPQWRKPQDYSFSYWHLLVELRPNVFQKTNKIWTANKISRSLAPQKIQVLPKEVPARLPNQYSCNKGLQYSVCIQLNFLNFERTAGSCSSTRKHHSLAYKFSLKLKDRSILLLCIS